MKLRVQIVIYLLHLKVKIINIPDILRNASNVEKITKNESKICLTGLYNINVTDR